MQMTIPPSASIPSGWAELNGQTLVGAETLYPALWANSPAGWKSGSDLTLPDGPRSTVQLELDVTTSPSHTIPDFIGFAYQKSDGQWRLNFNINANGGGAGTQHTITVAGVTFQGPNAHAITARANGGVTASGYAANGTSNIIVNYGSSSSYADISGDVAIDAKPTDAFVGADSRFSTFDEALEGKPVIKLYSDETSAVSVGVTEASETVAGVVKAPNGTVRLDNGNGFGSTGTKIREWSNSSVTGDAFTYTEDAINGDYVTVNRDCIASVVYGDRNSGGTTQIGISVNASGTDLSTNIVSITDLGKKLVAEEVSSALRGVVSLPGYKFSKGDTIRAHGSGDANNTDTSSYLRIQELYRL